MIDFAWYTRDISGKSKKPQTMDLPWFAGIFNGAGNGTRTCDLRITNALLYRLSYASKFHYIIIQDKILFVKGLDIIFRAKIGILGRRRDRPLPKILVYKSNILANIYPTKTCGQLLKF